MNKLIYSLLFIGFHNSYSQDLSDILPATFVKSGDSVFVTLFMKEHELFAYEYIIANIHSSNLFNVEIDSFNLKDTKHNNCLFKTVFLLTMAREKDIIWVYLKTANQEKEYTFIVSKSLMPDKKKYLAEIKQQIIE